ncbi:ATP synthase subunit A [Ignicoccus islandicus DSM 13165]|uniref:A-type ATP synthase subunit A n=1 Tax=Ignicoccus islandicus DSM 13165 TaxID=940295 RepID=A0A0U2U5X1_9CREN|nr:V-type ATP synthase subunit A [Ignicoccus islandicus]ALU11556.1 ATP synthase subunit A [Ignicoccus islandicus DSM 13165]
MAVKGKVLRVRGPVVIAEGMQGAQMYEVVEVGKDGLVGEITRITGDKAVIQVYEDTTGITPGEPVVGTGSPFSVELGPGLLSHIFDGVLRPLESIYEVANSPFIRRGIKVPSLDRSKKWSWNPSPDAKVGEKVQGGDVLGTVPETELIEHKVMVPPGIRGTLKEIAPAGEYTVEDTIAVVEQDGKEIELKMYHRWPIRKPRPVIEKFEPVTPLITGVRVLDTLFPMAKGGTGAIPGPFGSGKTVTLRTLAAWSDARVVIYVGCGERGNEMTDVLVNFPHYKDPWSGKPLMQRTILVANTSNMPVAAREASIYVGITLAEYYRDMGYDSLLIADSTSRWAEALRDIAGRMEEMPAEEGFPPYLASRLAEYYERAGRAKIPGRPPRVGSVTIASAVSPPGGDFSEPVTSHTRRFVRVFWALDASLAYARHYPAINWLTSYSLYVDTVAQWWHQNVNPHWKEYRDELMNILLREDELKEIVRLVGPESLSEPDKLIIETAKIIKEGFLQQNAFDPIDAFCSPQKQFLMMKIIIDFYRKAKDLVNSGVPVAKIREATKDEIAELIRSRFTVKNDELDKLQDLYERLMLKLSQIRA